MAIPPLAAEPLFHIGALSVTNAMVNGWIALAFFVGVAGAIRARVTRIPRGLQNVAEWLLERLLEFFDQVTRERAKSERFLPFVGTLFFFILFSNWIGILPGIGSIGMWLRVHGEIELVPLFRPVNSDLNMTLAMGVLAVTLSHVFGIVTVGFFKHVGKFIQLGHIFRSLTKGPLAIFFRRNRIFCGVA